MTPMRLASFLESGYIAASGGFMSIAVAIGMSVWRAREIKDVATYGTARWQRGGGPARRTICPDGVVLGRFGRDCLHHKGPEHVLCAPRRGGKGVGLVVQTLLTWPAIAIVHDVKGENWEITGGLRARVPSPPAAAG
jgi:type IV secretion system protein VirD4